MLQVLPTNTINNSLLSQLDTPHMQTHILNKFIHIKGFPRRVPIEGVKETMYNITIFKL